MPGERMPEVVFAGQLRRDAAHPMAESMVRAQRQSLDRLDLQSDALGQRSQGLLIPPG